MRAKTKTKRITNEVARLRKWRIDLGATQEEVAALVGITRVTYNNIETGKRIPNGENLLGVQAALKELQDRRDAGKTQA